MQGKENGLFLGLELGSTRIKAVAIDRAFKPVESGGYTWASTQENGVWTYSLEEAWRGMRAALSEVGRRQEICAMGVSAMMHGYLAFDAEWNLLVPFRTWQNTVTGEAAAQLTQEFGFNIPQRWSVAHFWQAVLNGEEHVSRVAHLTTLAGYIHYVCTGVNAVGVGEASGMFPIDSATGDYDEAMLARMDALLAAKGFQRSMRDLLPKALAAGEAAGCLTAHGAAKLGHLLPEGIPFAPAEGDAGTGMTATNAVAPRTGNVSAGTSIFAMVVLEKPLSRVYPEIDMVTTPSGAPVAMVHCNNCTSDSNAWASLLREAAALFGAEPSTDELYTKLYRKSLEGEDDCGGVTVVNYLAGEGVTHMDEGRPMVVRTPGARFTLANFLRAELYSSMATLKMGMDLLSGERVAISALTGHGGLFKTPGVAQNYLAAACGAPVACMETAGEGGPYGMALLVSYMVERAPGESLEAFLASRVFVTARATVVSPDEVLARGFETYMERFRGALEAEAAAIEALR